ncbi:MAG: peptidylprolyl isomerase [Flavobacteriia bacterium]|nr:MAG: peptidylprolyl isomerase [Flavobacteriia bacterium]
MKLIKISILILILGLTSCKSTKYPDLDKGLYADIETDKGDILLKLEFEDVPVTVANFVSLAEGTNPYVADEYKGKPFYDGLKFHRVVKDFVIQGGDPRGNGSGGPGYIFEDEFPVNDEGNLLLSHNGPGVLSMANSGPDANGSQFFITFKETKWLDGRHTVFGHVVSGQDVVKKIEKDDVIKAIKIIRVGKEAKKFDAKAVFSQYFKKLEEQKKRQEEKKEQIKAKIISFVKDNEAKAKVLPSGLKIITITEGDGAKPKTGTKVPVNYEGYFTTGDLFDTNVKSIAKAFGKYNSKRDQMGGYNPIPMQYGPDAQLIAGFREGLQQMKYGDKVLLIIPSYLAYGEQGSRGVIPPNTDLWFVLEIVKDKEK